MNDPKNIGTHTGFIAAINLLIEALRYSKSLDTDTLARALQEKINELRAQYDPTLSDAAFVLDQILRPLVSEDRNNARKLLEEPVAGNS